VAELGELVEAAILDRLDELSDDEAESWLDETLVEEELALTEMKEG
jgi:hypothetical protein